MSMQEESGNPQGGKHLMTKEAAARIQSAQARRNDGIVEPGTFAARAQSAADRHAAEAEQAEQMPSAPQQQGGSENSGGKHLMTKEAAARIQSAQARRNNGIVEPGSFAARAQSAADRHAAEAEQAEQPPGPQASSQAPQEQGGLEDSEGKHLMTKEAAARIQSAEARRNGGIVEPGSFAARAQSAADRHAAEAEQAEQMPSAPQSSQAPQEEGKKHLMTKEAAARIQSAQARRNNGIVEPGSFAARAQSAADRHAAEAEQAEQMPSAPQEQGGSENSGVKNPMTKEAAARIQSAQARRNNGIVEPGTFAARAQSAADRHAAQGVQ